MVMVRSGDRLHEDPRGSDLLRGLWIGEAAHQVDRVGVDQHPGRLRVDLSIGLEGDADVPGVWIACSVSRKTR
jgi:hypothetical protein